MFCAVPSSLYGSGYYRDELFAPVGRKSVLGSPPQNLTLPLSLFDLKPHPTSPGMVTLPPNPFPRAHIRLILHGTLWEQELDLTFGLNSDPSQKYNHWFSCLYIAALKPCPQRKREKKGL